MEIDIAVTVLGCVSQLWDIGCTVGDMISPLLTDPSNKVRVVDDEVPGRPLPEDVVRMSVPLSAVLTAELDGAVAAIRCGVEEILLAALGRSIARTIGVGVVTVSGLTTVVPIRLCCATARELDAEGMLADVRASLGAPPQLVHPPADVVFSYLGLPPDPTLGSLQLADGPALGVLAYRAAGVVQMDWWYDERRLEPSTVEELAAQFRLGLIELASEAGPAADAA